jgi:multiple sugar transport system ATP-binding protein
MIAGLDTPTSGQILLGDRDITHASPKDRDIAMVFQSYALYPNMTVAQNIAFGLEMRKVPKAQREEAIARVAKMLQIEHLLDRRPAQLSGGQRQRVAMGRALARNPRCSCSTSRCPTWTPSCAWRCAPRSSCCTSAPAPPPSTSPTTRSRP